MEMEFIRKSSKLYYLIKRYSKDTISQKAQKESFLKVSTLKENESLTSIMRKLVGWYDAVFSGKEAEYNYLTSVLSRSSNHSAVLQMMESSEKIAFKIERREVTLMM